MAAKPSVRPEWRAVRLRVVCVQPPNPDDHDADFGLQEAQGALQTGQMLEDGSLCFAFGLDVRPHSRTGLPFFRGPAVQGPGDGQFLYLTWRSRHVDQTAWNRRIKVTLSPITWEQIEEAVRTGGVLEARVPGRGKDGGPAAASVPLLDGGWIVRESA